MMAALMERLGLNRPAAPVAPVAPPLPPEEARAAAAAALLDLLAAAEGEAQEHGTKVAAVEARAAALEREAEGLREDARILRGVQATRNYTTDREAARLRGVLKANAPTCIAEARS